MPIYFLTIYREGFSSVSMDQFFNQNDTKTALEAQYEAQKIAFAPVIFQVARSMRDLGILESLYTHEKNGLTLDEIAEEISLNKRNLQVLLESSLSADIVKLDPHHKYRITKTGYFLLKDKMTRINMDYNHYVNYRGLYHLEEAVSKEKPMGLKVFGEWETIYPALSSLPGKTQKSWFAFDHYYSDSAFSEAIDTVLETKPGKILDVGGNTGRFSIQLAKSNPDIKITVADLPEQIALAKENIQKENLDSRINCISINILDHSQPFPGGYDIIWMSQFLDCFKEEEIVDLLKRAKRALHADARLYIMEPLWDLQRFETSAYCIINTSPYFTAMANGYSKMFKSSDLIDMIHQASLEIIAQVDHVGICQSILVCR